MAEFKKLSDVEIIETPIDTANVLIEENGVIKRVPKDEVGGIKVAAAEVGQTIVVKAVDENGNPTEWEAVDKVKSWNDLEDKPFDSKTYTVSNKSDLTNAVIVGSAIKVSDLIIPKESMTNAIITIDNQQTFLLSDILNDGAYEETDKYFACEAFLIVYEDNFTMGEYTYPEAGIYLPYGLGSETPQVDLTWTETKPLDTKYLPEHLQFGEEVSIKTIAEEQTIDFGDSGNSYARFVYPDGYNLEDDYQCTQTSADDGQPVRIVLDGVVYDTTTVRTTDGGEMYLGVRLSHDGCELNILLDGPYIVNVGKLTGTHTFAIYKPLSKVKPLDEKYLPDSVKGGFDAIIDLGDLDAYELYGNVPSSVFATAGSHANIATAFQNGKHPNVLCRWTVKSDEFGKRQRSVILTDVSQIQENMSISGTFTENNNVYCITGSICENEFVYSFDIIKIGFYGEYENT